MDKELRSQQRVAALDPEERRAQEQLAMSHWRAGRHMDAYKVFNKPGLGLESDTAKALITEMVTIQKPFLDICPLDWETETIFGDWMMGDASVKKAIESGELLTSLCVDHPCSDQEAELIAQIPFLQALEVRGQVGDGHLGCFTALKHLESLALWVFDGDSIHQLDQLTKIRRLLIHGSDFEPQLATQVVKLPNLNQLNLSIDKGPSSGLAQLKEATALNSIIFGSQRVDDSYISDFLYFAPLEKLYLEEMTLSQESINHISRQENLEVLHISLDYGLHNHDLSVLSGLTGLTELRIERSSIQSYQLDFLTELPNLRQLVLTGHTIDNGVIEALSQLQDLESLDISNSGISNRALRRLQRLTQLKSFKAENTTITSDGIRHLAQLQSLETVEWRPHTQDYQRSRDGSLTEFLNRIPPETEYFLPGAIGE
ncbi:MAG: hypothetical protein P1V97_28525 [Planctomycetota bacterium]|nr:hypothetical protein [Planctomycetota bacterium]